MRKVNTKFFGPEDHILYQIVGYCSYQYPHILFIHVPNEGRGKISFSQMEKVKALGVKSGVSDLLFFDPRHGFNGLAMEVKTTTGTISKAQRSWLANLTTRQWRTCVVRSVEEAKKIIDNYYGND